MSKSTAALLIFIKNPEKGKVKTRLARTVGKDKALQIYLALLGHTRNIALSLEVERYLFYSNFVDKQDAWSNEGFQKEVQQGQGLGERMTNAFKMVFENHSKVVIIGSDCASLNSEIVKKAFEKLDNFPFVIGPAIDGGYYLLGMNTFQATVFENIEWSTEAVFPETIKKIEDLEQTYYLLPELSDIDFEEDWKKFGWQLP